MIIINPGSGPVADASEQAAQEAMRALLADLGPGWDRTPIATGPEDDGRWPFRVRHRGGGCSHDVDMPGWPIEEVRWLGPESGSIWDFPRLYVDGSSRVWKYAVNVLTGCDGTDES